MREQDNRGESAQSTAAPDTRVEFPSTCHPDDGQSLVLGDLSTLSIPGYEVLGKLGRGGMGVVYKARDRALGRFVAIKMIIAGAHAAEEELARFRGEAQAIASLHHPHVVRIHSWGEYNGLPYIVLEYVEGGSLAEFLRGQVQSPQEAARLVLLLAGAVHDAHKCGIIHRDLKPGNILLAPAADEKALNSAYGCPKISDFGLARRTDGLCKQTTPGRILGSPCYMAPEQAAGRNKDIGPATDVYALGAILYECLTGVPPFLGKTVIETLDKIRTELPKRPRALRPEVPAELEALCLKCLHKDPAGRPGSALELADDLRDWLDHSSAPADAPWSVPTTMPPWPEEQTAATLPVSGKWRRSQAFWIVGALLAAAAAVLLAWRPWENGPNPDPNPTPENRRDVQTDGVAGGDKKPEDRKPEDRKPDDRKPDPLPQPFRDEREAAEWALKLGGQNGVNILRPGDRRGTGVYAIEGLPKGPFQITGLNLFGKQVTDADLARLINLKDIKDIILRTTSIKGPGLAHLARLPHLQMLSLVDTPLDEEGICQLRELRSVWHLEMTAGNFKPASLEALRDMPALKQLKLGGELARDDILSALPPLAIEILDLTLEPGRLTGMGGRSLSRLPNLKSMYVQGPLTRDSFEQLARLKGLTTLGLERTDIGDEDVARLAEMPELSWLDLYGCKRVSDSSMKTLGGMKRLTTLNITDTAITAYGAAQLEEAFQKRCQIHYTPRTDPGVDRLVAEWGLGLKNKADLRIIQQSSGKVLTPQQRGDLPADDFRIEALVLTDPQVSGADLARLVGLQELERVTLENTATSGAGLAHLAKLPKLTHLCFVGTALTDTGIEHLREIKTLTNIILRDAKLTEADLKKLREVLPKCAVDARRGP
jgi:serine/threonine protein kinase